MGTALASPYRDVAPGLARIGRLGNVVWPPHALLGVESPYRIAAPAPERPPKAKPRPPLVVGSPEWWARERKRECGALALEVLSWLVMLFLA